MRRLISLTATLGLLALGGCGGDDADSAPDPVSSGATGATGIQGSFAGGLTASEFIDASIPEQAEAVEELVAANPDCAEVNADPGEEFQVGVAITAAQSPPGMPLEEIVAGQCGG